MRRSVSQSMCAVLFAAGCLLVAAPSAAAEVHYEYDPALSLIGNCDTSGVDPIPDPGCPGGSHPPSGKFKEPSSVAIDGYGNEYVAIYASGTDGRIDIFDDEGNFISEVSDPFGPKSVAVDEEGTLYVFEELTSGSASEIARYTPTSPYDPEAGTINYEPSSRVVVDTALTSLGSVFVDPPSGRLYAAFTREDVNEYASFAELASPDEANPLLHTITGNGLSFTGTRYVTVDGQRRRLFASTCQDAAECWVVVLEADPPYDFLAKITGSDSPEGEFDSSNGLLSIAVDEESGDFFIEDVGGGKKRILQYDEDFDYVTTISRPFLQTTFNTQIAISNSPLRPTAKNHGYLFAPISGPNEAFAFAPREEDLPEISEPAAAHISETEGELEATIHPNGAETSYVFKLEEGGSGEVFVVGSGTIPAQSLPRRVSAPLTDLRPGTSYRFVVEATNKVGGAAPGEGAFATYADAPHAAGCPNDDLRTGISVGLPDCRAYELVTPPDTNGRPVRGTGYSPYTFPTLKASPSGDAVTFFTEGGSLPGMDGAGSLEGDRYRATRGASGWTTIHWGPNGTEGETPTLGGISPDQGFGLWRAEGEGTAVIGGIGNSTGYLQYPDGHSELVGVGSLGIDPNAAGVLITENATHIIVQTTTFSATRKAQQLEPNAPPEGTAAVYDRTPDGVTHVVSLLPPDDATPQAGENATYVGASPDGAGIAFEIGPTLYLRRNNTTTYEVGKNVDFAGVAEGGGRVFYVAAGDLLALDTRSGETIEFTQTGNAAVVNVAQGGTRAYFVSTTPITGAGENPNGAVPKKGQQNLYLSEEGQIRFVGMVTKRDVEGEIVANLGAADGLGLWTSAAQAGRTPGVDPSRLSPDGSVLLFQARANLDGHNPGGLPQIYRYDNSGSRLHCISCIPTGLPEGGGASLMTYGAVGTSPPPLGFKALLPNLNPDGGRAVFESDEALVSTDTDQVQDVYEWEEAGVGGCSRSGGCVYLLSSGHSGRQNYLYGMSRSGDDVFFVTEDVLLPSDDSTASVYDAKVGGGFAQQPAEACVGEGCRPTLTPSPALVAPGRPAVGANDNVRPRKCPKGKRKVKRKGKVRCVKKRSRHNHRAGKIRRVGR